MEFKRTANDEKFFARLIEANQMGIWSQKDWPQQSREQRLTILKKLETIMAECYQRPQIEIRIFKGESRLHGWYDPKENIGYINEWLLDTHNFGITLDSFLHITRYPYQHDVVRNPSNHPEIDDQTRKAWGENIQNYIPPKPGVPKFCYYAARDLSD